MYTIVLENLSNLPVTKASQRIQGNVIRNYNVDEIILVIVDRDTFKVTHNEIITPRVRLQIKISRYCYNYITTLNDMLTKRLEFGLTTMMLP